MSAVSTTYVSVRQPDHTIIITLVESFSLIHHNNYHQYLQMDTC